MPVVLALIFIAVFLVPILSVVFFILSLCECFSLRRENRKAPGSVRPQELKRNIVHLILSAVSMTSVLLILWGLGWVLSGGIPFM